MSFRNALRVHNFVAKTTVLWTRLILTRSKRFRTCRLGRPFQVNSSAVFKEDVDIVPVIIDDTLSYVPLGGDNNMPFDILKLIEDDETLSTCQMFNAEVCYGNGLVYKYRPSAQVSGYWLEVREEIRDEFFSVLFLKQTR